MVLRPRTITHVYTRRSRTPPSPDSSPSLIGSPSDLSPRYALCDRGALHPPERYGFTVASLVEPTTYRETAAHPDWQHAMSQDIVSLEHTGTWDLVPLPPHATPITCKWVYKIKTRFLLMLLT